MRITKLDNIIAGILFVALVAIPEHFQMSGGQVLAMYTVAALTIIGCWRLSYLRGKNEKAESHITVA